MRALENANWPLARVLFVQGISRREIVEACNLTLGALDKRVSRERWTELRTQAESILSKTPKTGALVMRETTCASVRAMVRDQVRAGLASDLSRTVASLPALPQATDVTKAAKRAGLVRTVAETSRAVFAWDEEIKLGQAVVRIDLLRESAAPEIDVTPQSLPEPEPTQNPPEAA